jgi:hypothetical protein
MSENGFFSGNPKTEWLPDTDGPDREMKLLEDFKYTDPSGREWLAPQESVVNGASIPRPLWATVGSPYTDDYRKASIVHDVACGDPAILRKEADKMFYSACLAGGCSKSQAALLYAGVRLGAWGGSVGSWLPFKRSALLYRLPEDRTEQEQELLDKYKEIAVDIEQLGDEPSFEEVDELIERKLK